MPSKTMSIGFCRSTFRPLLASRDYHFVDTLEQARTEFAMHAHRRIDHLAGKIVDLHLSPFASPREP